MAEKTTPPPSRDNSDDAENLSGRFESLVVAAANITLTMLRRGEHLEADLSRALEHVRESNKHLKEFVHLLETVDGDRWNERERIGSWLEIAERVRPTNVDDDKDRRRDPLDRRSEPDATENDAPNTEVRAKRNQGDESD